MIRIIPFNYQNYKYAYKVGIFTDKLEWNTIENVENTGNQQNPWKEFFNVFQITSIVLIMVTNIKAHNL